MKVNPDAAGMDARRLERITEHLQERYIGPGKIAGCQTAVVRHGQVAYFSSLGSMDLERAKPVAEDTIWRLYSMTKPITGVALMTLYERGFFQLDDPVHRFIPSWRDIKVREKGSDGEARLVDPRRAPTVRDVMMHTSGVGYGNLLDRLAEPAERGTPSIPERQGTLETMAEELAGKPLHFHPGDHWMYSLGTDVCARLVEVISGRRFDEYLQDVLFGPLGMTDTAFVVDDSRVDRFAANYALNRAKKLVSIDDPVESAYRRPRSFLSGGGGLVGNIGDYLRFCQMLLNGGELDGARVLGPKTVELMTANHLPGGGDMASFAVPGAYGEVGFAGMGFGLTMAVGLGPVRTGVIGSPGEYMWGGAASTSFWCDPVEELAVVFMTQLMPSGTFNFRGQLKTLVYPAIVD